MRPGEKTKIVSRLKRRFKTARAAWLDIEKRNKIKAKRVRHAKHTVRFWRWEVKA